MGGRLLHTDLLLFKQFTRTDLTMLANMLHKAVLKRCDVVIGRLANDIAWSTSNLFGRVHSEDSVVQCCGCATHGVKDKGDRVWSAARGTGMVGSGVVKVSGAHTCCFMAVLRSFNFSVCCKTVRSSCSSSTLERSCWFSAVGQRMCATDARNA